MIKYVVAKLIPFVLASPYLSFGLFFLSFATAINHPKEIEWKKIAFFTLFGLFNSFIIYAFRSPWILAGANFPRYNAFPVAMLALSYPLFFHVFLRNRSQIRGIPTSLLVYLLCFFAVTNGSFHRYANSLSFASQTLIRQEFYTTFNKVFIDYFQDHKTETLNVKNITIGLPYYPRKDAKSYARFILPEKINQKIVWTDQTDSVFLEYLKAKKYFFLTD